MSLTLMGIKASLSKVAEYLIPFLVFFFDPTQAKLMLALLSLMAFDTIIGGYYHYNKGDHSNKLFWTRGIAKFLKYFSAIAAARMLEYFLVGLPYSQELDTYVLAFLALTEAKSFYTYLVKFGLKVPVLPKIKKIAEEVGLDAKE